MGRRLENQYLVAKLGKKDLSVEDLEKAMHPNEDFTYGFLGRDESLTQVIKEDRVRIELLMVSYDAIASAIEDLFFSDEELHKGNPVFRKEFIHSPVCPWKDYCTSSSFDFTMKVTEIVVVNGRRLEEIIKSMEKYDDLTLESYPELVQKDLVMVFSDLHPHLIRDHHFFECHETPYRVDPEKAMRYLGIPRLSGK